VVFAGGFFDDLDDAEEPTRKKRPAVDESDEDEDAGFEDEDLDDDEDDLDDEDNEEDLDDEEDSDEDQGAEDAGEWEKIARSRPHRLKVDGEEVEVTYDELLQGYSRTEHFTRKSQDLSDRERTVLAEISAKRDEYSARLEMLEKALVGEAGDEPDWDALEQEDPAKFAVEFARHQARKQKIDAVKVEINRVRDEAVKEQATQWVETVQREAKALADAIPEWKDEAIASAEKQQIREFIHGLGYTDETIKGITDHKLMLIIRDAMRFRRQQTTGKKKLKDKVKKAKVLKPGGRQVTTQTGKRSRKARSRAEQRLAHSHSITDAARAIEHILDD